MRDARPGGGALKPQLISEHGAGQQANKAAHPRNVAQQQRRVQHVVDNYAKNPREGARQLKALGMSGDFIRAIHRSSVPNPKTRPAPGAPGARGLLDTVGKYTIGLGINTPSQMVSNLEHPLRGREPKLGRALTTDEFHRYQKGGHLPLDATKPSLGIVPWGPFRRLGRVGSDVPKTNADVQKIVEGTDHRPETVQKAHAGMSGAPAAYRATKEARSEELGKRVGKMSEAMASGTGSEAIRSGLRELKGPLPTGKFNGLHHMTDGEMEALAEHIRTSDKLTELEKGTAWKSIQDARYQRRPPPPYEQKILEKVFGPEFTQKVLVHSVGSKAKHVVIETANIPRAVMSSFDVSAPMRQGLVGLISHPVISSKELGPMLKAFGSEKYYRDWRQNVLEAHPRYEQAVKDRLAATDIEHSLSNREEPFQSNYAEHIPVVGHAVRGSGRAYNRFLVGQRFGIYNHLATHAEDAGIDLNRRLGKHGETLGEQLANLSNAATGRGQGRRGGFFERNAVELNATFFSPRLIKSRLDFLNPKAYMGLDPYVRAEKLKMAAKTVGAITTFLYAMSKVTGVKVGTDPRSSDFGKIRIGNTRIDVGGGFNQYIRFLAQEISNGEIDPNTGAIKHGQGIAIFNRFWRGKLAPPMSAAVNAVFRSDYAGRPLDWKSELGSRVTPLAGQDARNVLDQTHSWPAAIAGYAGSAVGLGVQSYGPPKPTGVKTADDLRNAFAQNVQKYFHRPLTPQIDKALKLRQQRTDYLTQYGGKRPKRGASEQDKQKYALARYNAQVDLMRKSKMITSAQAATAKRWASKQDRHVLSSRTSELGRKYFGGTVLSSAAKKIRDRGGKLYLGDY